LATAAEQSAFGLIGTEAADADLVAAVRAGDDRAFARLYQRYHGRVAAYAHGIVKDHARAEDITQDAFISALRRLRQTDAAIAFRPWIYEIAKNAAIDQFRRSRRAEEVSYESEERLESADGGRWLTTSPEPAAAIDRKQSLDHLCGAFGGLSDTHHEILVMRELEGLSYQQIAERMEMTAAAVESTLFRARKRLAEEYGELVSGRRCLNVQALIAEGRQAALAGREGRRVARHLSHCDPCRRQAFLAGLDVDRTRRRSVRERVAAVLPLPAVLRRRWGADDGGASSVLSSQGSTLTQMSASVAPVAEPLAGWMKAAAVAAALAIAGAGAGVATKRVALPDWSGLPIVGGSAPTASPAGSRSIPAGAPTRGRRGHLVGVDGPGGAGRLTSRPTSTTDESGGPGSGGSDGSAGGAERAGGSPAAGGLLLGGGNDGSGSQVPRPREVRREVRDTADEVVPGGLPRRPRGDGDQPVPRLPKPPRDAAVPTGLPPVPDARDPSSVLPQDAPALPETPSAPAVPNLPPPPDPVGDLTGILGG
jgi:RNA polymerase sigma factor (sigma-70 family)